MSRVAEAAEAIYALINSSPRSPSPEAIVAVLEAHRKALPAPDAARETYRASAWHRALEDYLVASHTATTDDALDRWCPRPSSWPRPTATAW